MDRRQNVERVDGTQARLKLLQHRRQTILPLVERVDGTQARLKPFHSRCVGISESGGKGGWDSGEIETVSIPSENTDEQ